MLTVVLILVIIIILMFNTIHEELIDISPFKNTIYISRDSFPNVIHKTFYENTENEIKLSSSIHDAIKSWSDKNPGYTIKIWDINESREYLKLNFPPEVLNCFDTLSAYAYKSDFFRYCVIYKNGGWYSDIFQICLQNNLLDNLKKNKREKYFIYDKAAEWQCSGGVQNSFFGAHKYSKVLESIINKTIKNTANQQYGSHPIKTSGSVCILGEVFNELGYKNKDFIGYFTVEDGIYPDGAYIYNFNNTRLIKHKCSGCKIKNGNDYRIMWENKQLYKST